MRGGFVRVAMNERLALGLAQPICGGLCINIGIVGRGLFACFALRTQATRDVLTLAQWFGQKSFLPTCLTHLLAKLQIVHIVQTQAVAMREQQALLAKL